MRRSGSSASLSSRELLQFPPFGPAAVPLEPVEARIRDIKRRAASPTEKFPKVSVWNDDFWPIKEAACWCADTSSNPLALFKVLLRKNWLIRLESARSSATDGKARAFSESCSMAGVNSSRRASRRDFMMRGENSVTSLGSFDVYFVK